MQIHVRLSGPLAAQFQRPRLTVTLPDGARVADLLAQLRAAQPEAAALASAVAVVDGRPVDPNFTLTDQQELALLIPTAGG
ncbi:MAG: MoaD/ThiS family protein [Bacillota bacterium]